MYLCLFFPLELASEATQLARQLARQLAEASPSQLDRGLLRPSLHWSIFTLIPICIFIQNKRWAPSLCSNILYRAEGTKINIIIFWCG